MHTPDDFERLFREAPPASPVRGVVRLICLRKGDGVHEVPARARLTVEGGVEGDRWIDKPERDVEAQVTLMTYRVAEVIAGTQVALDAPGDNFLVDLDLSQERLPVGTRLRLGGALLEISAKPHTGCKKFRERFGLEALKWVNDNQPRRLRGVNCQIIAGGEVALGDTIEVVGPAPEPSV